MLFTASEFSVYKHLSAEWCCIGKCTDVMHSNTLDSVDLCVRVECRLYRNIRNHKICFFYANLCRNSILWENDS